MHRRPQHHDGLPAVPARSRGRRARRALAVLATAAVATAAVGADAGAQSIEELRARAQRIAAELDQVQTRASELNEEYLATAQELQASQRRIDETRAAVADAEQRMEAARGQARGYAVTAYIGAGRVATVGARDANEALNSQVLLETLQGDQLQVADDLRAAQLDLGDRTAELERSSAELARRRDRQQQLRAELDRSVARQEELLSGANAELQSAIRAEQERQAAEAERRAREAAERAEAQRRAESEARAAATRARAATTTAPSAPRRSARPAPVAPRPAPAPAPPPAPVSAPNGGAAAAIAAAQSVLGTPYRWGGTSPSTGFDCSGLTGWAWARAGVSLPRTSRAQFAGTQRVPLDQIQPGDLVFYGSPIHHVGLYIGGGMMIHSPRTGDVAKVAPIHRGFGAIVGVGRVR